MKISLDGRDITLQAAPIERSRTILVNVAALSSALGLHVQTAAGTVSIVDTSGTEWKARSGSLFLEAGSCRLTFVVPMLQQDSALYLPLETAAELAGASLELDPAGHKARLALRHEEPGREEGIGVYPEAEQPKDAGQHAAARNPKLAGTPIADWQDFTLEKPAGEQETSEGSQNSSRPSGASILRQPKTHDNLVYSLGFGYSQGVGLNTQMTAEGRYLGANVRFSSQLAPGISGLPLQNTQFWWQDPETGKAVELGSFYSDLWGGVAGGRYAWQAGKNHQPAVSLYLGSANSVGSHPVLAFRDNYHVGGKTWVGGEVGTDGSQYLQGRFQTQRVGGFLYYRHLSSGSGSGQGASLTYDLGRGFSLYADINRSTSQYNRYYDAYNSGGYDNSPKQSDRNDSHNLGIHVPLPHRIDLTLEQTNSKSNAQAAHAYTAMLAVPLGPFRIFTRYQAGHSAGVGLLPSAPPSDRNAQEIQTSIAYFANPRLHMEFRSYASGLNSSFNNEREEFTTSYRFSNRTQFQITTLFADALTPTRNRLHLEHQLNNNLSLTAEYGMPSFFQKDRLSDASDGLTFMLRTHWMGQTPTRGGTVKGRVTDMGGVAVKNALVCLKDYQTQTDANGYYSFQNIPAGRYELNILESSLPADFKAAQSSLLLTLDSRSRKEVPLKIMPLHMIAGHVYFETDENPKSETGKGMMGIPVSIDGFVTATDKDGAFVFYNMEPGRHTIRLLADHLPEDLVLISPKEVVTELTPDHSVSGLVFRLKKHEKEILFQETK